MIISPREALTVLEHYKYLLIFPIAVFEGPIIIVISGFLVYLGFLNVFVAYIVLVVADVIGDLLYYTIGIYWRKWSWIKKYLKFTGYNEGSEVFLEDHFRKHKGKTFLIAKISHGIGGAVQITAGIARVNITEFIFYSLIGTMLKTLVLMLIGFYLGRSYMKIDNLFGSIATATLIILSVTIVSYILIRIFTKRYAKKYFE